MKIKSITSALLAGLLAVASMLFFTGCGETQSKTGSPKAEETTEAPKELSLPVSTEEALKMDPEKLQSMFWDAGFTEIEEHGLEDLESSSDKQNNVLSGITVGGKTSFKKGDTALSNAAIEIQYHSVKKADIPLDIYYVMNDKDGLSKFNYEDVITQFEVEGFKNISARAAEDETKTEGATKEITVNGVNLNDTIVSDYPIDAKVVITYYTKPNQNPAPTPTKAKEKTNAEGGATTPSFKETMDSYEAFFDSYIDFMKKYKENPSDLTMLSEYADYMSKYNDYMSKISAIDSDSLSAADLAYYTEVHARIMKKLAETGA